MGFYNTKGAKSPADMTPLPAPLPSADHRLKHQYLHLTENQRPVRSTYTKIHKSAAGDMSSQKLRVKQQTRG